MKTIDIIVPVYNTPIKDFDRCLGSIRNQTYQNWHLILIDDGSEGAIKDYLDAIAESEAKITVIHTPNQGPSAARNVGLEIAKGDYIVFCDADDTLSSDFLAEALELCETNSLDFITGGIQELRGDMEVLYKPQVDFVVFEEERWKILDYMLAASCRKETQELNESLLARLYPKLIRREVVNNLRFDNTIRIHEDNLYCFELVLQSRRIGVTNHIWYQYYLNDYSVTHHKGYTMSHWKNELSFAERLNQKAQIFDAFGCKRAYCLRILHVFNNLMYILSGIDIPKEERRKLCKSVVADRFWQEFISDRHILQYKNLSKKEIVVSLLFRMPLISAKFREWLIFRMYGI